MKINTSYQPTDYNPQNIQAQYIQDAKIADPIKIEEEKKNEELSPHALGDIQRQTYGLSVLKEMSDEEYRAFLRATAGMPESEKIFAAQSLYRLNLTYQKRQLSKNPYQPKEQDFLQAFQNALSFERSEEIL